MINEVDRLPDAFWTESELLSMATDVVNPNRYDKRPKYICWYHLYMNSEWTGKSMLLAVEDVVNGWESVNRLLDGTGLLAQIGWYGEQSITNQAKVEMLYQALEKWSYVGQLEFIGNDKVFTYEEWMAKLC